MTEPMADARRDQLWDLVRQAEDAGIQGNGHLRELLTEIDRQWAEIAIWQGVGAKVRGEYRAIPQHGGGVAWLRASDFGVDAVPLTDDEVRLIYGEINV